MELPISEKKALLKPLEDLFNDFFPWLAGQYDHENGGFYYAKSSRELQNIEPDIESSAQALNILERYHLIELMPEEMKRKLITFFQQKQDMNTGYFLDRNPNMVDDEVMVARAIGYSTNRLAKFGAKPLYPLPSKDNSAPDYMESIASYRQWLESIDLRNSWRGCDRLGVSAIYLAELPKGIREEYLNTALEFFKEIQDPETGLWGEGSMYVRISGTFKLHTFYSRFQKPLPRSEKIYESIIQCLKSEVATDMCYIRNSINLLDYMEVEISDSDLTTIIEITTANIRKLKREDGGFSREIANSPSAPNVAQVKKGDYYPDMPVAVRLSQGLFEGDMNASTQAVLIHRLCYRLANLDFDYQHPDFEQFYKMVDALRG
ncbi:hypothetical protein H1D32_18950 [Anaerobacillus sp. CMMVII]|uniref:hypothetical protein n=1 Tax=Anaerobacillus sp. CMMVII TaxID=2755588 RepID=UPI0021B80C8E|nr:hypothetical protein [Anaerobacillus sp. CMMVII]MCT8139598.1 hypothetical protein [Anaerobacillus sp. CMMVII]